MNKPCPHCQKSNPQSARFCCHCGQFISEESPSAFAHSLLGPDSSQPGAKTTNPPFFPVVSPDRYQIEDKLGQGGMGEVYTAIDHHTQRKVALKRISSSQIENSQVLTRFHREAKIISQLNHPYIAPLFHFGQDKNGPFITMPVVEGKTLRQWLKTSEPKEEAEILDLFDKIAQALFYAHRQGVIHRDLKPSNIMIDSQNLPRVVDFGLARIGGEDSITRWEGAMGTDGFAPPEQIDREALVDHRADIFGWGATLYFALTGQTPRLVRPDCLSEPLFSLISRCMEERPAHRYFSFFQVREALKLVQKGLDPEGKKNSSPGHFIEKDRCPCGYKNEEGTSFCENCGAKMEKKCPGCRQKISITVRNCSHCGVDVDKRERSIEALRKARNYRDHGNIEKALHWANRSREIEERKVTERLIKSLKEEVKESKKLLEIGDESLQNGHYQESIQYYEKAREKASHLSEIDDRIEVAKKKQWEEFLKKARQAIREGNLQGALRWCRVARDMEDKEEIRRMMEWIQTFSQREEALREEERRMEARRRELKRKSEEKKKALNSDPEKERGEKEPTSPRTPFWEKTVMLLAFFLACLVCGGLLWLLFHLPL